jgi:hypothetical protein
MQKKPVRRLLLEDALIALQALQSVIRKTGGARGLEGSYRANETRVCLQRAVGLAA